MGKYTARRSLIALVVLFIISIVDFSFINLAPGDPLQAMLSPEAAANAGQLAVALRGGWAERLDPGALRALAEAARAGELRDLVPHEQAGHDA